MSLELTIGANVQPAITAINDMKANLVKLQDQLKSVGQGTEEFNKLSNAIVNQKNQLQQALATSNAFSTGTFGVSRAARLAHADLEDMSRSIAAFASGSERGVDALGQLAFTFERSIGVTGGFKNALSAIGETLFSPVGLIVGAGALLPLLSGLAENFIEAATGAKKAEQEVNDLAAALTTAKEAILGFNEELDTGNITRKLKIDLEVPPGTDRTIKELGADLDNTNLKITNTQTAIDNYKEQLASLTESTEKLQAQQDKLNFGSIQFSRNKATLKANEEEIKLLNKQIGDLQKEADKLQNEAVNIPLKIQVVQKDEAFRLAQEAAKKAKKGADDILKDVEFKIPVRPDVDSLRKTKESFQNFVKDLNKTFQNTAPTGLDIPIAPDIQKRIDQIVEAKQEALKLAQTVQGALTQAFEGVFQAIESHQNVFKAFFKSLEQAVVQMVSKFLAAAAAAEIVSLILTGGSSGFTGLFSKLIGGGLPKFAEGGIVNRPTLGVFGEAGPEVIMPLDKLKGILGGMAIGGAQTVNVVGKISGNDLLLLNARTARTQGRGG